MKRTMAGPRDMDTPRLPSEPDPDKRENGLAVAMVAIAELGWASRGIGARHGMELGCLYSTEQ